MLRVYSWPENLSQDSLGHAAMTVFGGSPPGKMYISWWPDHVTTTQQLSRYIYCSSAYHNRTYAGDKYYEGGVMPRHVEIYALDETKIKSYWLDLLKSPRLWCTTSFNCSTCVYEALRAGGGPLEPRVAMWTPSQVYWYALHLSVALSGSQDVGAGRDRLSK
jgi:hypothetical protein